MKMRKVPEESWRFAIIEGLKGGKTPRGRNRSPAHFDPAQRRAHVGRVVGEERCAYRVGRCKPHGSPRSGRHDRELHHPAQARGGRAPDPRADDGRRRRQSRRRRHQGAARRPRRHHDLHSTNGRWDIVVELRADSLEAFDRVLAGSAWWTESRRARPVSCSRLSSKVARAL
jgi:hypothetical protein